MVSEFVTSNVIYNSMGTLPFPLDKIPRREERLLLSTTVLKLILLFSKGLRPRAASHIDTALVALAVFNAHLSGKPLTANKLSLYLSMPRTTVQARLDFLIEHGYAHKYGRHFYIREKHMMNPPGDPNISRAVILDAAKRLLSDYPRSKNL
jgi:hypothetical protein